jgi:NitT/TauT family transport system substrate-binding protein
MLAQLAAASASIGLSACSSAPAATLPTSIPAPTAAPTVQSRQLLIGYVSVSVSNAPTFSAIDGGYFKEQGLDVSATNIATSPQAVASMLSGELPLNTGISGTQIVAANRKGGGTLLLASSVNTFPFSILTQPEIGNVADLKGKKFGISQFGSASDTATRLYLTRNNLDPANDLTLIQTGGVTQTLAALQAHGIDAGLLTPPADQLGMQAGFRLLADIGSLGIEYCTNGVGTTRAYLEKNRDLMSAVLKAIAQGVHRFKTDQSFGESVIQHWTNADDPNILTASWKPFATEYLQNKLYVTDAGIQTVLDELASSDPTAKSADPKTYYDNSLLKTLDDSAFFASLGIPAGVN